MANADGGNAYGGQGNTGLYSGQDQEGYGQEQAYNDSDDYSQQGEYGQPEYGYDEGHPQELEYDGGNYNQFPSHNNYPTYNSVPINGNSYPTFPSYGYRFSPPPPTPYSNNNNSQPSSTKNGQPTSSNGQPASTSGQPSNNGQPSSAGGQPPTNGGQSPTNNGPTPTNTVQTPANNPAPAKPTPSNQPPPSNGQGQEVHPGAAPQAPGSNLFNIALVNDSSEQTIYCYVTGQNSDQGNKAYVLSSDGHTPWSVPDQTTDVPQTCVIKMGPTGSTTDLWIPHTAGGRIWFSYGKPLSFKTGPQGALVEPSVSAPGDANIDIEWGFAEFTWNAQQLYANISYVDFVGLPIALDLEVDKSKGSQDPPPVQGITPDSIAQIAQGLQQQNKEDNAGWDKLIVPRKDDPSKPLRILSPNQGTVMNPNIPLKTYFDEYIKQVWQAWTKGVQVDTQAASGVVHGQVGEDQKFTANDGSISMPSTDDIWTCCTGAFQTVSNQLTMALIPRLGAAINRGSALNNGQAQNLPEAQDQYYRGKLANHYARLVHEANPDGKGYAFPYDDVQPAGGADKSGEVHSGAPQRLIVTVGGNNAGHDGGQGQQQGQQNGQPQPH